MSVLFLTHYKPVMTFRRVASDTLKNADVSIANTGSVTYYSLDTN